MSSSYLADEEEEKINKLPKDKVRKPSNRAPALALAKPLGQYFNERIKQTFGLAWTQRDYEITEVVYRVENYTELFLVYGTGKRVGNVSATTLMIVTMNRVLEEINRDLNDILNSIENTSYS